MVQSKPIGRRDSDIIAGKDFLSVFMRNAEERYYPIKKTQQPYDIYDNFFDYDFTTRRSRFLVNTKYTTTTEPPTVTTTTRKPKLSIPTLPTIRKIETLTSEAPSNIELRTAPPPITKHEVMKYIKRKSGKEAQIQDSKKDPNLKETPKEISQIKEEDNKSNKQKETPSIREVTGTLPTQLLKEVKTSVSISNSGTPIVVPQKGSEVQEIIVIDPSGHVQDLLVLGKEPEVSFRMESQVETNVGNESKTTTGQEFVELDGGDMESFPIGDFYQIKNLDSSLKDLLVDSLKSKNSNEFPKEIEVLFPKEESQNVPKMEVLKDDSFLERKEDSITEVSIQINTEKLSGTPKKAVPIIEPSAIVLNSQKSELILDESDPLTIEATEINEKIVQSPLTLKESYLPQSSGAFNLENIPEEILPEKFSQKRVNRNDDSSYDYDFSSSLNQNKARSISYSAVIQIPGNWNKRKNSSESVADSNDYYVTNKYGPVRTENLKPDTPKEWDKHIYQTTEKNWGTTEKNWGVPSTQEVWNPQNDNTNQGLQNYHTTESNWGTTEKNWGTPKVWGVQQTTPTVWGVQQTTPKVWGRQQTTPKVWGVQQSTPKVWGVQQTTPKVWRTTEKNWDDQQTTPKVWGVQQIPYNNNYNQFGQPEQNYEVDETDSINNNGRIHGVQTEEPPQMEQNNAQNPNDNQKTGYVVEGRNYKKYRVEERTSDGFIVGEYGVLSNNDGSLRGVRYTADGAINPSLIYDALMKFLAL